VISFADFLEETAQSTEEALRKFLPSVDGNEVRLTDAMAYSALSGGKRFRPFLVIASAELFEVEREHALRVAVAVELIHTYSLIHDDLPSMDNDDFRRGKPSLHVAFDEATAILAGDALQVKAFEILSNIATHSDPEVRCELIASLSLACGYQGMVGGQMLDLESEHENLCEKEITRLQHLKTCSLISFSCEAGAILGRAEKPFRDALKSFAYDLGLAFQIIDDLLDVEGSQDALGKPIHKDIKRGKATLVSILGPDQARAKAQKLVRRATTHLDPFDKKADIMRAAAEFVISRDR